MSEKILLYMKNSSYHPMKKEELVKALKISAKEEEKFLFVLNTLEEKGVIYQTKKGYYGLSERMNLLVGQIEGNAGGYGFLIPDNPGQEDVYVALKDMNGAMHGDRVVVRIEGRLNGKRRYGQVIRILARTYSRIVGIYHRDGRLGYVTPDDPRIYYDLYVAEEDSGGAKPGQKVVVRIIEWPQRGKNPVGKIIEVLGYPDEPGVDINSIIREFNLPEEFSLEVWEQVETLPQKVEEKDLSGRRDFRNETVITIDPEDAKDIDDAVFVKKLEDGCYWLGVHIADVSYYIPESSSLDQEALHRGTSVYLVDRVLPMLPPPLSQEICSLKERQDRLTISVLMKFSPRGKLMKYEIVPGVIRVSRNFSYPVITRILEGDFQLRKEYAPYVTLIERMVELAKKLYKKRYHRGSLDFNFPEAKIILDEKGKPQEIVKEERTWAHRLIEEFMIAANETIAGHMKKRGPFIYRVHERPDSQRLMDFAEFIKNFGYHLDRVIDVRPQDLQKILDQLKGKPEEALIGTLLLRSLRLAKYSDKNIGHFGLASNCYTHFTSPIRRYPDLVAHRLVKEQNSKENNLLHRENLGKSLPEITEYCSHREQIAEEAEQESLKLKKVEFMQQHLGEEFTGLISGVTAFGIFVELEEIFVEGLVHLSSLVDDYYHFNEKKHCLRGEFTSKVYRLRNEVRVRVARVDIERRQIDFVLVEEPEGKVYPIKPTSKRRKKRLKLGLKEISLSEKRNRRR